MGHSSLLGPGLFRDDAASRGVLADGTRRAGGGDGNPIAKPLGLLLIFLLGISALAHLSRQSQISAALLTGLLFGWAKLDTEPYGKFNGPLVSAEVVYTMIELGNCLVLFFAGLSANTSAAQQYWWPVLVIGSGYFVFSTGLFSLLGWASGLCVGVGTTIFFGVCCSLSSKQLMVDHLVRVNQYKTLHSKILQGVALFQDAIAAVAMAILDAFFKVRVSLDEHDADDVPDRRAGCRRAGDGADCKNSFDPPENAWHDRQRMGDQIGISLALIVAFGCLFILLNKFCLEKVFRFFTADGELLFVGTMAYNLGASALCTAAGASPMVGSYLAGLSLSFLPSRHQIENKISSLRGFGMTTFYFMMGIYVHIDGSFFGKHFAWSLLFTGLVVFVAPIVIWIMGGLAGLTSRTTVYTSLLSNSLGETTLTLQVLAYQAGIFDKHVFLVLVVSTLLSINMCCVGTLAIDWFYDKIRKSPIGRWLDQPSQDEAKREADKWAELAQDGSKEGPVVILGFNETGQDIAEYFREEGKDVFVVDLDPSLHAVFRFAYKGVKGHRKPRCGPIEAIQEHASTPAPTRPRPDVAAAASEIAAEHVGSRPEPIEALSDVAPLESKRTVSEDPLVPAAGEPKMTLPGEPDGVTVAGEAFGADDIAMQAVGADAMIGVSGANMGFGKQVEPQRRQEYEDATALEGGFMIDGHLFGSGTNIFSILADPELESTWERVKLKQASLVVACLVQRDSERMCHYMKDSKVPVMSVCSDNGEAARLYRAGCTYALQQDFVAAKEFLSLLRAERVAGANDDFKDRSLDHQDQLTEESHDAVLKLISAFI